MWNGTREMKKHWKNLWKVWIFFSNSCMKEMKYVSGAYVEEDLGMYPVNDRRILNVIIQRQYEENSMIEIKIRNEIFAAKTCSGKVDGEIHMQAMILKEDRVYWCDCWGFTEETIKEYTGTVICAEKVRWRSVEGHMGNGEFTVGCFVIDKSMSKAEAVASKWKQLRQMVSDTIQTIIISDAIIAVVYCIHSKKATINHGYLHSVQCFDVVLPFFKQRRCRKKLLLM